MMKKVNSFWIIQLLTFTLYFTVHAQNQNKPLAVFSAINTQVLYVGLDNPVHVVVAGVDSKDIQVSMEGGVITEYQKGKYYVKVNDQGVKTSLAMMIVTYPWNGNIYSDTQRFFVKYVPKPEVSIGGQSKGVIKINELLNIDSVYIDMGDFYYMELLYSITRFSIILSSSSTTVKTDNLSSNKLTLEMKEMLKKAVKGDKLIICDVWATGKGIGEKRLGDVVLTIGD